MAMIKNALCLLLLASFFCPTACRGDGKRTVRFFQSGKELTVFIAETADTPEKKVRGLMFRKELAKDAGMLFIYPEDEELAFWMKNTLIPLDIIFFSQDMRVVGILHNLPPCKSDPCPTYPSLAPAKYALEINAGLADALGLSTQCTARID
ncbi:MAG: DUF192 domain-containing protein [Deltaproteobacteria bacterium]|nr:DUF192 domain-containing protein [Deltaproteobacteria bacterium]